MGRIKQEERGITLIALIVTIIIMLILAGISIKLAIDNNGVIENAKEAKNQYEQSQTEEDSKLSDLSSIMKNKLDANRGNSSNSGEEESTVTVSGFEVANLTPKPTDTCNFSVTTKKSNPQEKLKFTYKFYTGTSQPLDTSNLKYCEDIDIIDETNNEKSSVTIATSKLLEKGGGLFLVKCIITDTNGIEKANVNLVREDWASGYTIMVSCLPAGTEITVEEEEEDEKGKKKKVRKKKKIEDLNYNDKLLVWDFDHGCFTTARPLWLKKKEEAEEYNLLKFSDGSELKTIKQHRIFNKELGKFTYPMTEETPIGTTTFTEDGKEVKLVSKEVIKEHVAFYNVITYYHMNAFANGILTSCRLSNLYKIKDMKYVKDDRKLASREEYKEIPDDYFYGMRISEQPRNVNNGNDERMANTLTEYVNNCIANQK